jgi:hypothetical protein
MMEQIERINNPLLKKYAEEAQYKHIGDFGMTVMGGVDLEFFAQMIVIKCARLCTEPYFTPDGWSHTNADQRCSDLIKEHFGVE